MRIIIKHLKISNTKNNLVVAEEKTIIDNVTSITFEEEKKSDRLYPT